MSPNSDTSILIRETLQMYKDSFIAAYKGVVLNWTMLLLHICLGIAVTFFVPVSSVFGGMASGFFMGLVLCLVLAVYSSTLFAAVASQKIELDEIWGESVKIFFPLLNVLFVLFIAKFVFSAFAPVLGGLGLVALSLAIGIVLNAILEVIYLLRPHGFSAFSYAFEFFKENWVEWFVFQVILCIPLFLISSGTFLSVAASFLLRNPLETIESVMLSASFNSPLSFVILLLFVVVLYFILVARGCLFEKLNTTTKRKRIYQWKVRQDS